MSANNISETQRKMDSVERKLMYKSHGQWTVKTTGTIALGALAAVAGIGNVTAHVDTLSPVVTQSTPAVNETVSAPTQNQQATTVSPVVTQANNTVNTADNMTVDQIMHLVESQIANVSATGSVDGTLAPLISEAQSAASQAGIVLKSGQTIDVSSMTPEQIQSLGQSLVDNYKNVAGHDEMINSAVPSVSGVVASAGGKMTPGSVIDATNWTPEQIASLTASEADAIGETQNANEQLSEAVARTSQSIHEIGGKTIIVSVKQTEGISI